MICPNQPITLKNGKTAVLRNPLPSDAAEVIDCLVTCSEETHFLLRYPEEWQLTIPQEQAMLQSIADSPARIMLCCEIDGSIVGICNLSFHTMIKTRHKADVAISIRKEYWGLGIGKAMFARMIELAKENGISRLELECIEGNERAKALYEKVGFAVYGIRPDSIRLKDGTLLAEYCMSMEI